MAGNIERYRSAGFKRGFYSQLSSSGFIIGKDGLASTDVGEHSPVGRIYGEISTDISLPEPVSVAIPGDNGVMGTFFFASSDPIKFKVNISIREMEFEDLLNGSTHETMGEWEFLPFFSSQSVFTNLFLQFVADIGSNAAGDSANVGHRNLIIPNAQVRSNIQPMNNKEFSEISLDCIANPTDTLPDGRTVISVYPNAPDGKLIALEATSQYPLIYESYVGKTSDTVIPLTYKPISTTKTRITTQTTAFALDTASAVDSTLPVYSATPTGTIAANTKFSVVIYESLSDVL